jgi:16S rRNA (guanine1516-N2)-methyltransferase
VVASEDGRLAEATALAQALRLPLVRAQQPQGFSHALVLTPHRLELRTLGKKPPGPISANLSDADIRRRIGGGKRQSLARACGLHRDGPLKILDATAGLGRDAVVLAGLGCEVTLLERSPVIAALLRDGVARAERDELFGPWLSRRVKFAMKDAVAYMQASSPPHDVVYLDPMYPPRGKRALARKEMRALRAVVGDDADADRLLEAALDYAARRVVVKRPPRGELLGARQPDHQLKGNLARYDVYFTRKIAGRPAPT